MKFLFFLFAMIWKLPNLYDLCGIWKMFNTSLCVYIKHISVFETCSTYLINLNKFSNLSFWCLVTVLPSLNILLMLPNVKRDPHECGWTWYFLWMLIIRKRFNTSFNLFVTLNSEIVLTNQRIFKEKLEPLVVIKYILILGPLIDISLLEMCSVIW